MQPEFGQYHEGYGAELICPSCGGKHLHHEGIEAFDRDEDQASIDTSLAGKPGARHHGLSLHFSCENCDARPILHVAQHKGTFIDFLVNASRGTAQKPRLMPHRHDIKIVGRSPWLHFVVGTLLLWAVAYATISANYPKLYAPYSFVVVIPLMSLHELLGGIPLAFIIATLTAPVLFAAWSLPLLTGQKRIPNRTKVASLILVSLSLVMLALSWPYGLKYQGALHTVAMCLFNVAFWAALLVLGQKNSREPAYITNFLFHWFLFAWLGWVAFPWLGELI